MIFLFIVDTSCSMNQRTHNGMSLLDCAKSGIEHFIKVRNTKTKEADRYLLVTTGDSLQNCVKSGWKDDPQHFLNSVKELQAFDLTNIDKGLQSGFDLLNSLSYRLQRQTEMVSQRLELRPPDCFGQGRYPFKAEYAAVIVLTDGTDMSSLQDSDGRLILPNPQPVQKELCSDLYRWEQRVFSIMLKIPATLPTGGESKATVQANHPLAVLSDITGGTCVAVKSLRQLQQHMEEMINTQLHVNAVVVNFEQANPTDWHMQPPPFSVQQICGLDSIATFHTTLTVRKEQQLLWPIPESFYVAPGQNQVQFGPRSAQPTILVLFQEYELPPYFEGYTKMMDRYDLDPHCALSRFLIAHAKNRPGTSLVYTQKVFRCYIQDSHGKNNLGEPFGFVTCQVLQPGTLDAQYNPYFFVLPYNFPRLFHLIDELCVKKKLNVRQEIDLYLQSLPYYYVATTKELLARCNIQVQDRPDGMPPSVAQYLKTKITEAKIESDKLSAQIMSQSSAQKNFQYLANGGSQNQQGADFRQLLTSKDQSKVNTFEMASAGSTASTSVGALFGYADGPLVSSPLEQQQRQAAGITKNPFDISRTQLLSQLVAMKQVLYGSGDNPLEGGVQLHRDAQTELAKHSIPIAAMGAYEQVQRQKIALRDPFEVIGEGQKKKKKFKRTNKDLLQAVDEAEVSGSSGAPALRHSAVPESQQLEPGMEAVPKTLASAKDISITLETADAVAPVTPLLPFPGTPATGVEAPDGLLPAPSPPSPTTQQTGATPSIIQEHQAQQKKRSPAALKEQASDGLSIAPVSPSGAGASGAAEQQNRNKPPRKKPRVTTTQTTQQQGPQLDVKPKIQEDLEVIRDIAKIPGVLSMPDKLVQSVYDHTSNTRFLQQNATIYQDLMKIIKQPRQMHQDAEKLVREKMTAVSGTEDWKRSFATRLAHAAAAFGRHNLRIIFEQLSQKTS